MQYVQIAEMVLSKLPTTLQTSEARTMSHAVRETRILTTEIDNEGVEKREDNEDETTEIKNAANETEEDLV